MAGQKMSGKKKGAIVGTIGFGAVFALICAVFHPSGFGGILASLLVSGGAGIILGIMGSGLDTSKNQKTGSNPESTVHREATTEQSASPVQKGEGILYEIRREKELLSENDAELSGQLSELEEKCGEIFRTVEKNPEKTTQIRKFMAYYLPTTLKLVRGYRTMDNREEDAETQKTRQEISEAIGLVNQSCDTLLQKLHRNELLDMSIEIDVLQQMLRRDGLTESELEQAAEQARAAAALDTLVNERRKEVTAATAAVQEQPAVENTEASEAEETAQETASAQTEEHLVQCPTISGGVYTLPASQAMAVAPKKE